MASGKDWTEQRARFCPHCPSAHPEALCAVSWAASADATCSAFLSSTAPLTFSPWLHGCSLPHVFRHTADPLGAPLPARS